MSGYIDITNYEGGPLIDPNCGIYTSCPRIQTFSSSNTPTSTGNTWQQVEYEGCKYWAIKTCILPANIDSEHDEDDPDSPLRSINPQDTTYTIKLNVGTKALEWEFQIDAAQDYTDIEIDGCIPIAKVLVDGSAVPATTSNPFVEIVCTALNEFPVHGDTAPVGAQIVGLDSEGDCRLYDALQPLSICDELASLPDGGSILPEHTLIAINSDGDCVSVSAANINLCDKTIQSALAASIGSLIGGN